MATHPQRDANHRTRVGRERSERTESRIVVAARRVFGDMGPDAPTIDDFLIGAGISRGTFYNHFQSVEELLAATSEWTTRETLEMIEGALAGIDEPALRLSVGFRLFFAKAKRDPAWCRFVARVWKIGGIELLARDLEVGLRRGVFRAPSAAAAKDLLLGGVREALSRMGSEKTPPTYGEQMTELLLRALGVDARRIAVVMKYELSPLPGDDASTRVEDR